MSGDQVEAAVASCTATLRAAADRDWEAVNAAGLEWSCRTTAFHIAEDFAGYASRLAARARHRLPLHITLPEGTDNAGILQVIEATGALLAAAVRTAPPGVRAFHPYPFGSADREGFAAMGVAETLLHTHDIARGLGLVYEPPAGLAESVLGRLFPHVQPGPEPWPTLLWATGRGELPGRAPVTDWTWYNNLVIPAGRVTLTGIRPAAARDLALGGDGGFDWLDDGPYEGTREACTYLVKAYEAGVHRPEFGVFALVRPEDGRAVGGIGFHGAPDEDRRVEIGYDLVTGARGQGYATEALRALTEWALARDDVGTVIATVEPDNLPSQRVVTRAGFTRATVEEEPATDHGHAGDEQLLLYVRRP
ncbi:GNAT family N-acetyltransferase [Streptomyces sp. NRRL S-1022]|uniref:GNAT family N-acetyltransferase n=1 Tax=Streptomyces sp. NRRL S-1022 TaxID=1463880 RepID=UPI001F46960A|nr:GNAT family N-acetyltransferase [Streptomyces sp. NRRL S-1022]